MRSRVSCDVQSLHVSIKAQGCGGAVASCQSVSSGSDGLDVAEVKLPITLQETNSEETF